MNQEAPKYLEIVEKIASTVVAENAASIDKEGRFPREAVDALGREGLLGLISAESVGGMGLGIRAAAEVVERLARECASTAMVACMHYSATAVLEKLGPESVRRDIAAGKHLSTLALSEAGSRSQFWAPVSTAKRVPGGIQLDAKKSFSTSASEATAYVWSSKPLEGSDASTVWLVPRTTPGIRVDKPFDGLGLRGNDSSPITAEGAIVPESALLGKDGGGFAAMMEIVLPIFNVVNAGCSVGLMEAGVTRTAAHVASTRFEHSGTTLADLPTIRAYLAKARVRADMAKGLWLDTMNALESGRGDAMLRVLEVKAACGDAAIEVLDICMRVAGGAAFRREVGVERYFRDTRAAAVMGPTSDALYDFIGKAVTGLPLFG
jgi:alkylation response protein AidB-like acyl-CoA dehydrogenase